MTGIKSAIDLVSDAFRAFTGFAMEGLDAIATYEKTTIALTSLTAAQMVQAGAAKDVASAWDVASLKAEELTDWVQELAIHSPFTFSGVVEAFRLVQTYTGFATEDVKRLVQAMTDFAAGSGASEYAIQKIALALGQISTAGKLTGQDMLQLTSVGVPVADILAEAFGKTKAEIMEMRSAGLLPAQEVIEAITVWMETNFAGAADRFSMSWAGLMGTFADLKEMGLREFFGSMFETLQPLANAFSEWFQTEGLVWLRTFGDILGGLVGIFIELAGIDAGKPFYDLGAALAGLNSITPYFGVVGEALREMQTAIDLGATPFQALKSALDDLATTWANTPLGDMASAIRDFISTAETEGIGTALRDLFANIFSSIDFQGAVQTLLNNIANLLNNSDTTSFGQSIAQIINNAFLSVLSGLHTLINLVDWRPIGEALGRAIGSIFEGMASDPSNLKVEMLGNAIGEGIQEAVANYFNEFFRVDEIQAAFTQIGKDAIAGYAAGFSFENMKNNVLTFINNVINYFKQLLGIASPSTVFYEIGRNIVQGLIGGIGAMLGSLVSIVTGLVSSILELFAPVLELFGIDLGGSTNIGDFTGGGTGGRTPITGDDRTPLLGGGTGGVTNIFNGPVYFGDMSSIGYDCPSPHPLMTASSQSLLTTVSIG